MELLYDLLREACTYFLLSFLVVRFLSLIVSTSDNDSLSGLINDNCKSVEISSRIDQFNDHPNGDDDNFGGYELKEVHHDAETHNKIEELIFRDIDIVSSEVKSLDVQEVSKNTTENNNPNYQEVNKLVEFGGELIDHEKRIMGLEDKVGKNITLVDQIKEPNMEFEDCTSNHEIGMNLGREEVERLNNVYKGEVSGREFKVDKGVFGEDDEEWEGIERSELEKVFERAMNLVECKEKQDLLVEKMGNDVIMKFYGLQKVAMEGPCNESQPMAIMRTARAKWNAWKKLGNMTPEDAMEQYISLLSNIVPEWMKDNSTISTIKEKPGSLNTALDSSEKAN